MIWLIRTHSHTCYLLIMTFYSKSLHFCLIALCIVGISTPVAFAEIDPHVKECGLLSDEVFLRNESYKPVERGLQRDMRRKDAAMTALSNLEITDAQAKTALEQASLALFQELTACNSPKKAQYGFSGKIKKQCIKIYSALNTSAHQLALLYDKKSIKTSALLSSAEFKKYAKYSKRFFSPASRPRIVIVRSQLIKQIARYEKNILRLTPRRDSLLSRLNESIQAYSGAQCGSLPFTL